jgi:hypothetical protein
MSVTSSSLNISLIAKRFDELPDSSVLKGIWKAQGNVDTQTRVTQTWEKVKSLFFLNFERVSDIQDTSDIEKISEKIDHLSSYDWECKLYDAALFGDNDTLETLLENHEFLGPDLGEALKKAAKLYSTRCINIILQCRQFDKIPTYFVAQAFENAKTSDVCKEALKGHLPRNYQQLIPEPAIGR